VASNHISAPNRIYGLKKITFIEFPVICFNNLNIVERRNPTYFHLIIHFAVHFGAPWTLPPGAAAPFPTPDTPLVVVTYFLTPAGLGNLEENLYIERLYTRTCTVEGVPVCLSVATNLSENKDRSLQY
jgi:hypothetical protein